MGCTLWSLATINALGFSAVFYVIGLATNNIVEDDTVANGEHVGLFTDADGVQWLQASQAMAVLALILMAVGVFLNGTLFCCEWRCGRNMMLILEGGAIFAAAVCASISVVTYGAHYNSHVSWTATLGFSYVFLILGTLGLYVAGAFVIVDMIKVEYKMMA